MQQCIVKLTTMTWINVVGMGLFHSQGTESLNIAMFGLISDDVTSE